MANPHTIKVPKQPDRSVVELFQKIAAEYSTPQFTVGLGAAGNIQVPSTGEEHPVLVKLLEADLSILESASIPIPGFSIAFYRGGYPVQNHPKSAVFDEIGFNFNQQQCKLSEEKRIEIISVVSKSLGAFDPARTVPGLLTEDQQNLLAIHSSTLERLEKLNERLISGSEEFRRNLESDFQDRSDKLENDFRERADALNSEHDKKKTGLEDKESALAKKLKEIDDRQNTHVRREIRKDILEEIRSRAKEFKLTEGTNKLRKPVHAVSIFLILALGAANVFYALELTSLIKSEAATALPVSVLAIKQLFLSAAFGATAIFYLRWLNLWSSEHAAAEFSLRQFQLDIERASWVVETALEWKDAREGAIPNELLEPITRNLFDTSHEPKNELHPADELASALMGTAAKVRLKAGDSEVELDGKKLGKAN